MDTAAVVVAVVSIVSGKTCLLVSLWLRLRWRTRHEQVQRRHLASVAQAIREGGQAEVVERRPDGHCIRIKITSGPGEKNAA